MVKEINLIITECNNFEKVKYRSKKHTGKLAVGLLRKFMASIGKTYYSWKFWSTRIRLKRMELEPISHLKRKSRQKRQLVKLANKIFHRKPYFSWIVKFVLNILSMIVSVLEVVSNSSDSSMVKHFQLNL